MTEEEWAQRYDMLKAHIKTIGAAYLFGPAQVDPRALPAMNMSFSSSGEDLWLRQFMKARLRTQRPGFYVDVGSNHPITTSNTYLFYTQGWKGICIDANLAFVPEFQAYRPRDTFVNAAVSDLGTSLYFAEFAAPAGHKMARVALDPKDFPPNYTQPKEVPARTLAEILREHVPSGTTIDFMTVDLEDSELPALRSNDWNVYKPRVILIECGTGFDPLNPFAFPTIGYLKSLGYKYEGFSSNNVLLTAPDFSDVNALVQQGQA